MIIYLILLFEFAKIGLFSVGGGMATLPFLFDLADKYDWLTRTDITDMVAISESTPGPLGINMATFAGYAAGGVGGGLLASLALVIPGFIVAYIMAGALQKYRSNLYVDAALAGIRPAATGLIAAAGLSVLRLSVFSPDGFGWLSLALFALIIGLQQIPKLKRMHPLAYIAFAAVCGIVFKM